MATIYDKTHDRLIKYGHACAGPEYWDAHWKASGGDASVIREVKRFIPPGSKILEAGCGTGQNVRSLSEAGYDCYGVDTAARTIKKAKEDFPGLKLDIQDVRGLKFKDGFFDGYISLGVIEHFIDGYEEVTREAERVLRPGGIMFLGFPYISPLRRSKIWLGLYSGKPHENAKEFYQYMFSVRSVKSELAGTGFKIIGVKYSEASKCIKDEMFPFLQGLYDSRNFFAKGVKFTLSLFFSGLAGHTALLVLKNEK